MILYSYFFLSGMIVRFISPPFAKYIAYKQELEGNFRRLHARVITNSEEIAFLDGAEREKQILNEEFETLNDFSDYYFYKQFRQGIADQWILKYQASCIGWPVIAVPFLLRTGKESAAV